MIKALNHKSLSVYKSSRRIVVESYKTTETMPASEKFGLVSQIRRAAVSVNLNLAEGFSRKSEVERIRFFEISRSSLVELDAAIGAALDLKFLTEASIAELSIHSNATFAMISTMIKNMRNK